MKTLLLILATIICSTQLSFSQEDGVVSLAIPVRSSLKYNRYLINPTFSFVREQNTYINITNKREWSQFEDAPQTFLINYSGRYKENMGVGVGLFQQNYGVLTSFGGILNFAYNARLQTDSNLTFGLNLGFYKSSLNDGKVVVNQPDPSLENIPNNMVLSVSPGINYGMVFLDFGLAVNNLVQYNIKTSELIEDDPQQSIQAHVMYTGFMYSRGFFDQSKFTTLIKSEFKKDQTIISGIAMLSVPKGIWAQVGYNSVYGLMGGIGVNITKQISVEYNYEKAMGDLTTFGSSHEFTLAYKFKSRERYDYSGDEREEALLIKDQKKKPAISTKPALDAETRAQLAEEKAIEREAELEERRLAIEARAIERAEAQERAKLDGEAKAQALAESQAQTTEAEKAEEKVRLEAEALAQAEAAEALAQERAVQDEVAEQARLAAEAQEQARLEALAIEEARLEAEKAAQTQAAEQARLAAEAQEQARLEALAIEEARLEVEKAAKNQAAEQARLAAEAQEQARLETLAIEEARLEAEKAAQTQAAEQARLAAEAQEQARLEALAIEEARLEAEKAAQTQAAEQARLAAEAQEQARLEALAIEEARLAAEQEAQEQVVEEATQVATEITQKDELAKSMFALTEETKDSKAEQDALLIRLNEVLIIKEKDLNDLKEENDLSEQGIYLEPKPFKSITAENRALEALKSELDNAINERNKTITEIENLYNQRIKKGSNKNDETSQYYLQTIQELKAEQAQFEKARANLVSTLETINIATEFERKRRIKRALYDNEKDRFIKDKATLERIKETTTLSTVPLTVEDFNFGEEQSSNVQILKGVQNVEKGYYMIIAVHENVKDRDAFLEKVVASGESNVNFFYDVNSSKYFIYYQNFDYVEEAMRALNSKENKPYNEKMTVVKIED
jgi:type IX secretion system PorP/SprF family membrane protein